MAGQRYNEMEEGILNRKNVDKGAKGLREHTAGGRSKRRLSGYCAEHVLWTKRRLEARAVADH